VEVDYGQRYRKFHASHPSRLAGLSIEAYVPDIAALVERTEAKTLLDYGCGKGHQYLGRRVHEQWGGILPVCYDVGVPNLAERPIGPFDGVICTDVLEHIHRKDVDAILADIFGFATKFVFLAIGTTPAKKKFEDGQNLHLTVELPRWWLAKIDRRRGSQLVEVRFDEEIRRDKYGRGIVA
jgi:hypothetical protein